MLFVTGVATLIHLYSIGYMHGDEKFSKFFVYLNLFVFSMLMLVLGDNLLITFLGWEGVGACSYFLISFWFTQEEANASPARRRSSRTAIGDFGFMIGIFLTFAALGTINYLVIGAEAETLGHRRQRPPSRCSSSSGPSASPRRSRCQSGCPTPWPARPRCPP